MRENKLKRVLVVMNIVVLVILSVMMESGVQFYKVNGVSMNPTLADGKIVVAYETEELKRGDIVFMEAEEGISEDGYVKRIVAVAGDKVEIKDGKLYVNGKEEKEDYGYTGTMGGEEEVTVEKGHVYVLGDNREKSMDSRMFGTVSVDKVNHKGLGIYK